MSMHFVYGFVIATLICQLWGQFPSKGHPLKSFAANVSAMLPMMVPARATA